VTLALIAGGVVWSLWKTRGEELVKEENVPH
jgi:hypothetical protein